MAHFEIPLDIPHAGRLADRIQRLLEKHVEEIGVEAPEAMLAAAENLSNYLFRFSSEEDNPPDAVEIRDEAANLGRALVFELEHAGVKGDRIGQYIRNFFECLELGREGAEISLRAGENPNSLQRPV